jgi:O-antigen/teichoic acid export membrane protein
MFRNIVITFFTRFFIAISNLVIAVLLSNYLGATGRGEQSLIITSVSLIIVITSLIGTSSISYFLPRYPFSLLIIPSYLWVLFIILICLAVLPFLSVVPKQYTSDVCFLSLLLSITNINFTVLIGHQKINSANILNFVQTFVTILVLILFFTVIRNISVDAYLKSLYAGYGAALVVSFFFIRPYITGFQRQSLDAWKDVVKKLATFGFYNQMAAFIQILNLRLSYYILNSYFGKDDVGIYSNAVSIAESIWLISRSIATVQHARIVNSSDNAWSISLTSRLNKYNLTVSLALLVILVSIPGSWYQFLFGDEFRDINRIIWTLSPGIISFGIFLILGYYFSSTGRPHVNTIANLAGIAVTLVTGFTLIPAYNSFGAGFTASLSYSAMALVVVLYYFREKKKVKGNRKATLPTGFSLSPHP